MWPPSRNKFDTPVLKGEPILRRYPNKKKQFFGSNLLKPDVLCSWVIIVWVITRDNLKTELDSMLSHCMGIKADQKPIRGGHGRRASVEWSKCMKGLNRKLSFHNHKSLPTMALCVLCVCVPSKRAITHIRAFKITRCCIDIWHFYSCDKLNRVLIKRMTNSPSKNMEKRTNMERTWQIEKIQTKAGEIKSVLTSLWGFIVI